MTPLERLLIAAAALFALIAVGVLTARPILSIGQRVFDLMLEGRADGRPESLSAGDRG